METLFPIVSRKWKGDDQKSVEEDKWRVKMEIRDEIESPPSINLHLGIGRPNSSISSSSSSSCFEFAHSRLKNDSYDVSDYGRFVELKINNGDNQMSEKQLRHRDYSMVCFTQEQLQDLKFQILIFKNMISGLPVPLQLLLPIWKTYAPPCCHLNHKTTPWYFQLGMDRFMDPEPGRCRRTDGKKWRCHKSVVPNEKYCENHMHRGRKRSRKLVETSKGEVSQDSTTLHHIDNTKRNNDLNSDLRIRFPANLDHKPHSTTYNKKPMNNYNSVGCDLKSKDVPTKLVIRAPSMNNSTAMVNVKNEQINAVKNECITNERIVAINLSSGLDFSPKIVLNGGQKNPRNEDHGKDPNSGSRRCQRTDGKKWRCSNEVLSNRKYCVNRGSKKEAVGASTSHHSKLDKPKWVKMGLGMETDLNFSPYTMSVNTQQNNGDDGGMSEPSSETTVSE